MLVEWKMFLMIAVGVSVLFGSYCFIRDLGGQTYGTLETARGKFEKKLTSFLQPFLLCAGILVIGGWLVSGQVYVVEGEDKCTIYRTFGPATIKASSGQSFEIEWDWLPTGHWQLVNLSGRHAYVESVAYGDAPLSPSVEIPSMTSAKLVNDIDYFFNNDIPPRTIETEGTGALYHWVKLDY